MITLQTILGLSETGYNDTQTRSLKHFIETLAIELIASNDIIDNIDSIDPQIFLNELESEFKGQELHIELTNNIGITVIYRANCDFVRENGIITDVDTCSATIEAVKLFLHEGSVFELESETLNEIITKELSL